MAKKRFTDGLESLFEEPRDKKPAGNELLLFPVEEKPASSAKTPRKEKGKKSPGKSFTNDLQSFLQEAFEEAFEERLQPKKNSSPAKKRVKKRRRKARSGLDALIRSTVQPSSLELLDKPTRRLTVTFDLQKLEKLKNIARLEKTYLKDIIDEIVGEYISKYDQKKTKRRSGQ